MSFTEISQEFQKALESMLDETIENFIPENNFQATSESVSEDPIASLPTQQSGNLAASPPRRPTTRSQTGTVAKRRTRSDGHVAESRKRAPPARKRQKVTVHSSIPLDSSSSHTQESASPRPPTTREASLSSTSSTAVQSSTQPAQLTFYHSSMSESDQPQNHLPRSRASLPTPIPNLTKKSRGRRVPTKESTGADPNQKNNRLYVCTVEGCGKCFHRGEHLKRHIRSIHTHEKPFKCTFPLCEKFFNRHDNLLQHLKVHRQSNANSDDSPPVQKISFQMEMGLDEVYAVEPVSAPEQHDRHSHLQRRSYSPAEEEDPISPVSPPARPRTIYDAFPPRYGPFALSTTSAPPMMYSHLSHSNVLEGHATENPEVPIGGPNITHENLSSNEAMSILSNVAASTLRMEVSSLRTELPQSPVDMRTSMGMLSMGQC